MRKLVVAAAVVAMLGWCACSSSSDDTSGGGTDGGPDDGASRDGASGNEGGTGADGSGGGDGSTKDGASPEGGPPAPPAPFVPPVNGTRLHPRFDQLASGLQIYRDILDTTLNVACTEGYTADGTARCVPVAIALSFTYADAACTQPIAWTGVPDSCPAYIQSGYRDTTACTGGVSLYQRGAVYTGALYNKLGGSCTATTRSPGVTYYSVGTAVPDSTFAALTTTKVSLVTGVDAVATTSADGMKVWHGALHDGTNDVPAKLTKASDDKMRVLPNANAEVDRYKGGSTCNIALAAYSAQCETAQLGYFLPQDQCGYPIHTQLYPLGQMYTNSIYNPNNNCSLTVAPAGVTIYEIGAEIPPTTFPEGVASTFGDAHVTAQVYQVSGHPVPLTSTSSVTDAVLKTPCSMLLAADGKRRCLPQGALQYFTDAACTQAVFGQRALAFCGPNPTQSGYGIASEGGACTAEPKWHAYALGATIGTPAAVYSKQNADGSCQEVSLGSSYAYYTAGAEIPAANMAEATTVP